MKLGATLPGIGLSSTMASPTTFFFSITRLSSDSPSYQLNPPGSGVPVAGMIAAPIASVYPNMGSQVLIMCFVVVVIGGIGSVRGALIAALLVGLVDTFGKVLLPSVAGMLVYMLMAGVLLWKPEGLFKQ